MKRFVLAAVATVALAVAGSGDGRSGVERLLRHGGKRLRAFADEHALCRPRWFGAFGPGNDWRGGASGDNTAYANSTLCGKPQGAAGVDEPGV